MPSIVVSGSFRRHFDDIRQTVEKFESLGIRVLSPRPSQVTNPGEAFAILSTDTTTDPQILEQRHLDAITASDALYICNPDGRLGNSTLMELGFAYARGKMIFCAALADDESLQSFCGTIATPEEVAHILQQHHVQSF